MPLSATISPVKETNGRQAPLKYSGRVEMGDSVFLHLAGGRGVKFGERDGWRSKKQCLESVCLHVYMTCINLF